MSSNSDVYKMGPLVIWIPTTFSVQFQFYGPRIGALYHREGSAPFHPLFFGGGQENGLRAGTENTPMIAGLGQASALVIESVLSDQKELREKRDLLEKRLKVKLNCKIINFKCEVLEFKVVITVLFWKRVVIAILSFFSMTQTCSTSILKSNNNIAAFGRDLLWHVTDYPDDGKWKRD